MRIPLASVGLLLLPVTALSAQGALKWGPGPDAFPKGAKMAVVSGDPAKAGPLVVQFSMPSGYKILPHFHPADESVTVKKGTLMVGMGDKFDATKAKQMKVGEKETIAAAMHHYASTKGKTLIEVTTTGPFAMTYVNPKDDPRSHAAKKP